MDKVFIAAIIGMLIVVIIVLSIALCKSAKKADAHAERIYELGSAFVDGISVSLQTNDFTNFKSVVEDDGYLTVMADTLAAQGCPTDKMCESCEAAYTHDTCVECWKNWLKT